jgi:dienelactone hydrolase
VRDPVLARTLTSVRGEAVRVAGVPALLRYVESPEVAARRGTVLFYHGFGGTKEKPEAYLSALAQAGFLAVSLDAVGHGERRYPDFDVIFDDERWDASFEETEADFLRVIEETAAEVPAIIDDLGARGWVVADRVGVAGRSLGGCVSYASVLADSRVRAIVSVVGSPEWTLPRAHSPHHHPDRFFPAAVLSQAAEFDEHCPPGPIRAFHAALEPFYSAEPDRIAYVEYRGVRHALTPALVAESERGLVDWFRRWLPEGRGKHQAAFGNGDNGLS